MNYREFKEQRQNKVNEFVKQNMFYAFSDDQYKDGLRKLNTTPKEIIAIDNGGYLLKAKLDDFNNLNKELDLELKEYISNSTNLYDALIYEMYNLEYFINENSDQLLGYLGLDAETLTDEQRAVFGEARKQYYKEMEENLY